MVTLALLILASVYLHSPPLECALSVHRSPRAITELGSCLHSDSVFIIDPTSESADDGKACHVPQGGGKSSVPCKTLDYALGQLHLYEPNRPLMFYLASPNIVYNLSRPLNVTNRYNFGFCGNHSHYPVIPKVQCEKDAGLSFINCSHIVLSSIEFLECGALHVSTSRNYSTDMHSNELSFLTIRVSLYFYNCTSIEMYQIGVLNSYQATGVVMYDTNGVVDVRNSVFKNNTVPVDGSIPGGGGFTVEFTYCRPGDVTCGEKNYDLKYKRNKDSLYTFDNCTFEGNVGNKASTERNAFRPAFSYHDATGRGGGLSVYFKGDCMNNSVTIVDSRFIKNHAVWGGGVDIHISDSTMNNSVSIINSNLTENGAGFENNDKYTGGGGIHIVSVTQFFGDVDKSIPSSKIYINGSSFKSNKGLEGGAACISLSPERSLDDDQLTEITISNSSFEYNQARLGNAVTLLKFPIFNSGKISDVKFYDCNFSSNSVSLTSLAVHPAGLASIYTNGVSASFQSSALFYNNSGSALVIVGAMVNFTGTNTVFKDNEGVDGGAIALLGASSIVIGPKTSMTFDNNTAERYGGAIFNRYIGKEDLESTANCFLRYSLPFHDPYHWDVWFNFSGNVALKDGCSIASTSVYPCTYSKGYLNPLEYHRVFRWNERWHYENQKCEHEFFTRAKNFTLNNATIPNSDPIPFYPGQAFTLPLSAHDEFNNNITDDTIYSASVLQGRSVAEVEPGYAYVASNYIGLSGTPGRNITIFLETDGSRTMHVMLNLTILQCPPGFVLMQKDYDYLSDSVMEPESEDDSAWKMVCQCPTDNQKYRHLLTCFYKEFITKIHVNYWYGPVNVSVRGNKTVNLVGMLPISYRYVSEEMKYQQDDASITLPNTMQGVDQLLCGNANRTGVLCGHCIDGYAVAVNSLTYQCVPCDMNSTTTAQFVGRLFVYVALTYIPIIVIFIVIIFFKIKLASSAAAGFLLYAQIIGGKYFDITGYSLIYVGIEKRAPLVARSVYTIIYGIFNLQSFANYLHPFCLNEHFTTLHVLCLDYAIAAFPLVVIVVIFLFYKCKSLKCRCPSFGREQESAIEQDTSSTTSLLSITNVRIRRKRSPNNRLIHALVAFVLLSYTKFSLASMWTLTTDELFDQNGLTVARRIYVAGHLSFSDTQFIFPFGLLAILILIFIVFLPPLLLLGPLQLVDWLIDKPKLYWLRKLWPSILIHTFLDTLQGYRPNRRFFAGLYLLFRLFMFLTYSFFGDLITQYTFQQIIIFILAILVSLLRPYTNDFFNYVDTFLFLNLGILNAIAIYTFEHGYSDSLYGFECFLVFLPLMYIICYLIWNKCRKRNDYKLLKHKITHRLVSPLREASLSQQNERQRLLQTVDYSSADDPDEDIFRRAESSNRFQRANIQTVPPKRSGEVPKSVISFPVTSLSAIEENDSKEASDSGIGRQSNSAGADSETQTTDSSTLS